MKNFFDLNGDGKVDALEFLIATAQDPNNPFNTDDEEDGETDNEDEPITDEAATDEEDDAYDEEDDDEY